MLVQRAGDVIPQVVRRVSAGVGDAATNRTGSAADALAAIAASGEARRDDLAVEAEERRRFDGVSGAATTIIPWTMPLSCPVCSAPVVADGMAMRCSATSTCPAQTVSCTMRRRSETCYTLFGTAAEDVCIDSSFLVVVVFTAFFFFWGGVPSALNRVGMRLLSFSFIFSHFALKYQVGQLIHSVGRKALDIRGIGKAKLAELQARGVGYAYM